MKSPLSFIRFLHSNLMLSIIENGELLERMEIIFVLFIGPQCSISLADKYGVGIQYACLGVRFRG